MKTCVVAFSGGLDTSFLVPFVKEKYGFNRVITCTVNTGGFSEEELQAIAARSKELGADEHMCFDETEAFCSDIIKYLILGNVTRDGYPLCVGSERLIQGRRVASFAKEHGALVHGSTGAGNDQYRFDLVARVIGVECYAPVRELSVSKDFSTDYLKKHGINVPQKNTSYSYNVGLWGVSIGGKETLTINGLIQDDA
jgi:argininosuccinate synthase